METIPPPQERRSKPAEAAPETTEAPVEKEKVAEEPKAEEQPAEGQWLQFQWLQCRFMGLSSP